MQFNILPSDVAAIGNSRRINKILSHFPKKIQMLSTWIRLTRSTLSLQIFYNSLIIILPNIHQRQVDIASYCQVNCIGFTIYYALCSKYCFYLSCYTLLKVVFAHCLINDYHIMSHLETAGLILFLSIDYIDHNIRLPLRNQQQLYTCLNSSVFFVQFSSMNIIKTFWVRDCQPLKGSDYYI